MAGVADTSRDWAPAGQAGRLAGVAAALLLCVQIQVQAQPPSEEIDPPAAQSDAVEQTEQPAEPDAADAAADQADDQPEQIITHVEALIEFRALVEQERFADAVPVGEEMVRLAEQERGERSEEAASAYVELAEAQRRAGLHEQSEINFLHAVDVYRAIHGPYSAPLIVPLVGLGDNYQDASQHRSAISAYNEARTVSRRVHGLLNEQQIPIIDRMTDSMVRMNLHSEANEQQLAALELIERSYPAGSEQVLDAIYKYGRWLRGIGRYREEREQYQRAMQIIRDHAGRDSVAMVRPLRETGNSFRTQRLPEGAGANALRRAREILEAQPETNALALAEVMRDIGDWQAAFGRLGPDGSEYRHAWQLLGFVEDGDARRADWFTGVEYVLQEPVSQRGLSNEPNALRGQVLVQFNIDELGRPGDVTVISSDPPGFKDEAIVQSVRRSRFRPQMADGEIVRGERLQLQFVFGYVPE